MYLALIIAFYLSYNWKKATIYVLTVIAIIALADQTCAHVMRPFFERMRPCNPENPISDLIQLVNGHRTGGKYGFPSCHAANSFALASSVAILMKKKWLTLFLFIWAIINSYSRIYLGAHYPGDLIVGAIVGTLIGIIAGKLVRNTTLKLKSADLKFQKSYLIVIATGVLIILYICLKSL